MICGNLVRCPFSDASFRVADEMMVSECVSSGRDVGSVVLTV